MQIRKDSKHAEPVSDAGATLDSTRVSEGL